MVTVALCGSEQFCHFTVAHFLDSIFLADCPVERQTIDFTFLVADKGDTSLKGAKSRIYSHKNQWLYELRGQIYIRLGTILSPARIDDTLLEDVESALILSVQPPYNEKKRGGCTYRTDYYVNIHNKGFRGQLPKIIDAREQAEEHI